MTRRTIITLLLAMMTVLLILAIAGCGADSDIGEEFNDSPKLNNVDTPAVRISFPNGFGNVAAKCFGTDMVYSSRVTAEGRSIAVSPNHGWCRDGVLTVEEQQR